MLELFSDQPLKHSISVGMPGVGEVVAAAVKKKQQPQLPAN